MTIIIFYDHQIRDIVAQRRTLRLQAGRGGNPERFWLGNGSKSIFLGARQASDFLTALDKMNRSVQRGKLVDRVFYSFQIEGVDGGTLGIDHGILTGRAYVAVEDARVDVSPDDLAFFAGAELVSPAASHGHRRG